MNDTFTMKQAAEQIGVTKNTLFLWEKAEKVSRPERDRNNARICTPEWIAECIAFRDKVTKNENG